MWGLALREADSMDVNDVRWLGMQKSQKTKDLMDWRLLDALQLDVSSELLRATKKFGAFNSAHEGYAVLLEEVEELWEEIKKKPRSQYKMKTESIQIAAMALRLILDCYPILDKDGLTDLEFYDSSNENVKDVKE